MSGPRDNWDSFLKGGFDATANSGAEKQLANVMMDHPSDLTPFPAAPRPSDIPGGIAPGNRGASAVAHRLQYHRNTNAQTNPQADILNPDENARNGQEVLQRGRPVDNASDTMPRGVQDWLVDRFATAQQRRKQRRR